MKKSILIFVLVNILSLVAFSAPTLFEGERSWSSENSELLASGSWANEVTLISWKVDMESLNGNPYWLYTYTLDVPEGRGGGISHFVLEVSKDLQLAELVEVSMENGFFNKADSIEGPKQIDDIWGVKFNLNYSDESSDRELVLSFYTQRDPMWGNFYAKGGLNNEAYNEFLIGQIAVPNSVTIVPTPSAILLSTVGIGFFNLLRRKI